ncbi:MAG: nicotinamide mononucleotide transporter [Salinivirgaceae bacterium]|nr:nicotinamide mononucleotide transporter [Salinivirgaceae bacterium]
MNWLADNWLELFGVVSTIIYLVLSIRQSIWLWPLGALSSALYVAIYFVHKFYADMGLQVYYLIISIYGFYIWASHKTKTGETIRICSPDKKQWIVLTICTLAIFGFLYWLLANFTDSPIPAGDAFTTALAITATWMLTRKMIEQWLIFIVADSASAIMYAGKEMQLTAFLYIIYTAMAIIGYLKWRKEYKNQLSECLK